MIKQKRPKIISGRFCFGLVTINAEQPKVVNLKSRLLSVNVYRLSFHLPAEANKS
jgi:hypothetical protein